MPICYECAFSKQKKKIMEKKILLTTHTNFLTNFCITFGEQTSDKIEGKEPAKYGVKFGEKTSVKKGKTFC